MDSANARRDLLLHFAVLQAFVLAGIAYYTWATLEKRSLEGEWLIVGVYLIWSAMLKARMFMNFMKIPRPRPAGLLSWSLLKAAGLALLGLVAIAQCPWLRGGGFYLPGALMTLIVLLLVLASLAAMGEGVARLIRYVRMPRKVAQG